MEEKLKQELLKGSFFPKLAATIEVRLSRML